MALVLAGSLAVTFTVPLAVGTFPVLVVVGVALVLLVVSLRRPPPAN
jgi:hypothetical protein